MYALSFYIFCKILYFHIYAFYSLYQKCKRLSKRIRIQLSPIFIVYIYFTDFCIAFSILIRLRFYSIKKIYMIKRQIRCHRWKLFYAIILHQLSLSRLSKSIVAADLIVAHLSVPRYDFQR